MELRTILYGYDKHQFEYLINEEEAKIVQRIFNEYLAGKTLLQIGNALTEEKVVYYKDRTTWSKQAVRRVLENQHYVGDREYPSIIDRDTYKKANALRLGKGGDREKDSVEVHYLKYHTKCTQCGGRVSRKSHYSREREAWNCVNSCKTPRYLDDKEFLTDILEIVNRVIEKPALLMLSFREDVSYTPSIKVQRDERTLGDLLQKEKLTFQAAKKVLFDILGEKFNCCTLDKSGAVSESLIEYVRNLDPIESIDVNLFKVILEEILVDERGEIALRFVNGAVIKKDERGTSNE